MNFNMTRTAVRLILMEQSAGVPAELLWLSDNVSAGVHAFNLKWVVTASWSEYGKGWSATEPLVVHMKSQEMSALEEPCGFKKKKKNHE